MRFTTDSIKIIGMSAYVPSDYIDNANIDPEDKKVRKLIRMTGINRRHTLKSEKLALANIAVLAAQDAVEKSGTDKEQIKVLVYITQNPEFLAPATAFYIQKELGLGSDCIVFDVNLGCSGFVAGLQIVASLLMGLDDRAKGLLLNGEYLSRVKRVNANDELLFGDAATATVLEKNSRFNIPYISDYYSDGNRYKAIFQKSLTTKCHMDGQGVFDFSVYEVSRYIKQFLADHKLSNSDIDHIAFHQAQKFIIDHLATNAGLDKEKMLYSLDEYANTSGASIPLSICNSKDKLKEHGKYLLCGFGVGLAWGTAIIQIDRECVFGIQQM